MPRSGSSSALKHGNPYSVNMRADHERCAEEARVRSMMEQKQRKQDERLRERIRRQVVQAAIEEARQVPQPLEIVAALEDEKRVRAWSGLLKVEDRYDEIRSDLRRRFYEPTLKEREQREVTYLLRKASHAQERDARRSELNAVDEARAALLVATSEKRLQAVEQRRSQINLHKSRSAAALNRGPASPMRNMMPEY